MALPGMLVDPRWLRAQPSSGLVIADVRWVPGGHASQPFARGHLPGAVCVDLDADLAAPAFRGPGRHPLPQPAAFAATMSRLGIGDETPVVAYDDQGGWIAARLWWMLRVLGREVALLDLPSLEGWTAAGWHARDGAASTPAAASFTPASWPSDRLVDADEVARVVHLGSGPVLDARAGERYRGEIEPIDPVAGHIPGAVSADRSGRPRRRRARAGPDRVAPPLRGARGRRRRRGGRLVRVGRRGFLHDLRHRAGGPRSRAAVRGLVVGLGQRPLASGRDGGRARWSAVNAAGHLFRR